MYFNIRCTELIRSVLLVACIASIPTVYAQNTTSDNITLQIGTKNIQAEVANTPTTRATGLMYRRSLPADHGMLFVFEETGMPCFWMKNTPLPLDIAFIDNDGLISNIEAMEPFELNSHCPIRPVRYALEMEQGWFKQHDKQAGDKVSGLP